MNKRNIKVKNVLLPLIAAAGLCCFVSCSSDGEDDDVSSNPGAEFSPVMVNRNVLLGFYRQHELTAELAGGTWRMDAAPADAVYILEDTLSRTVRFVPMTAGQYTLTLRDTIDGRPYSETYAITVDEPEKPVTPWIAKVFDILPAPGQFVNSIPLYDPDRGATDVVAWTTQSLVGREKGDLISLGGFGGYVVFGFDHTILNIKGRRDFRIFGNSFWAAANPNPLGSSRGGSCEPGVIWVAYDKNGNGKPDDDEWYEIAGSEYDNPNTIHDYEITYYRPESEENDDNFDAQQSIYTREKYIRWEDNQGQSGWIAKNVYHSQSYYPQWVDGDKLTFRGTRLPDNGVDEGENTGGSHYWVLYGFDYGYADNAPNDDPESAIDIDWAVDKDGNRVHLPGIDFVKVVCGMRQECGWLGENSTEIQGAVDLHLKGEKVER